MSVTVQEALKLPSMRNAYVAAGNGGLAGDLFGVTVFDYPGTPALLEKCLSTPSHNPGRQMILTSFSGIEDDEALQCECLRRLHQNGEAALVLYYVGAVVKKVFPALRQLADSLDFPLIVMPEGRMDLRYGDMISELGSVLLSDKVRYSGSMVTEIISQVSKLPQDRRTVDSVLSLLSGRLHVSLILTDSKLNELGFSPWPSHNTSLADLITEENVSHHVKRRKSFSPVPGSYIWYAQIHDRGIEPMRLFLIEEGSVLNDVSVDMAKETVQLAVELWSNSHSAVLTSELVKAILNDEPIRMRRLSEDLHIDIKSIHTTWLIRRTDGAEGFSDAMVDAVRKTMKALDSEIILEPYRTALGDADDLILFFRNPLDARLLDECGQKIISNLRALGCNDVYLTMLDYKFTTSDVRKAFTIWNENEATAREIFPYQKVFHESEIELARQCNGIIRLGEASIASATGCLDALGERHGSEEFLRTLAVYFLDAGMNMQTTSDILNVHKNTVKYRINMVCDVLGHGVDNPVTSAMLTTALAIRRLLDKTE